MKLAFLAACTLVTSLCLGHTTSVPSARAKVQVDGSIELKIRFDVLAFVLDQTPAAVADPPMYDLLDLTPAELNGRLKEAGARFRANVRLLGSHGTCPIDSLEFPTADEIRQVEGTGSPKLPLMLYATVKGHLPNGDREVSFSFPKVLGDVVLTAELPYEEPVSEPVEPGAASTPLLVPTDKEVAALAAKMHARAPTSDPVVSDSRPPTADTRYPVPETRYPFLTYIKMGFLHIMPFGLDHILFVLGLFLLSTRTKDLLKQVTAFTVAHSLTLALSLFGVFRLPTNIVEPLIALSIVFVAVENICTTELKPWRVYVVFAFGLVHGLGFAGALTDTGLAKNDFLALIGFNVGVELGQLSVVAIAFLLFGWFRTNEHYRQRIVVPASALIAVVALFWTIQRAFFS